MSGEDIVNHLVPTILWRRLKSVYTTEALALKHLAEQALLLAQGK